MATDLTTLNWENGGASYKLASVGANNEEVLIPKWCKLVTVAPKAQAIYFSYTGTHNAPPSAHALPQAVDSIIQYNPQQTSQQRKIYIAAQAGTANIFLIFE